jgi:hypothetical protein
MDFLKWMLSGVPSASFSPGTTAAMIVASVVWYYHRTIEAKEGQPSSTAKTLHRWYVYIMCTWGLCWFSFGIVHLVHTAVLYLPLWGSTITSGSFWNGNVHAGIASITVGGAAWVYYWFITAKNDFGSILRNVYLYLLTIFGGAVAGLVALTVFIYEMLRYFISGTAAGDERYFLFLGWTVPTIIVAGAVWLYHQQKAQEEASRGDMQYFSARRVLLYLMAFIGLGTLIAGMLMLCGILIDAWINAVTAGMTVISAGWWHNQISLSLALLIVAIPVWYYYWNKVIRLMESGGIEEWRSRSRRVYFYVILGAAIIALTAALVNIVYQIINGFLEGSIDVAVLRHIKWSLQTLVVAAPVLFYHFYVLKQDQRRGAESIVQQKNVIVLADKNFTDTVSHLEKMLGYRVRRMTFSEESGVISPEVYSDEDTARLADAIRKTSSKKVMVIADANKMQVLPYYDN